MKSAFQFFGTFLVLLFLLFMVVAGFSSFRDRHSLFYTIAFKEARGLHPGDPVKLGEDIVGVVKRVRRAGAEGGVLVRVRIDPLYLGKVLQRSTALIHDGSLFDTASRRQLEVINPETDPLPPPLPAETRVQGVEGQVELHLWRLQSGLLATGDALTQSLGALAGTASAGETGNPWKAKEKSSPR